MPITTASIPRTLWPGVNAFWGMAYKEKPKQYTEIYKILPSTKGWEEDVGIVGLGLAPIKQEGLPIQFFTMTQGFIKRYTHVTYGIGFIISKEAVDDGQYPQLARQRTGQLAYSLRQTVETVCAGPFNHGFDSSFAGADGIEFFSTVHLNAGTAGGTWSNTPDTAADLSEAAIEDGCITIRQFTNDKGNRIQSRAIKLLVPPALEFDAHRILDSNQQAGNANNDTNVLRSQRTVRDGIVVNDYFTDANAWFLLSDAPEGLKYFDREGESFDIDNEFTTRNGRFIGTVRFSVSWTDARCAYGSPGVG